MVGNMLMVAAQETQLLNLTFLENRLGELDLKNWWVAEYIGVDRKTLTRWLTGKVKTIKKENLLALADCLKCKPEELILEDDSAVIASQEEQSIAAQLIVQENLLATLTPLGQWPLLESVVKATMQPHLPLPVMGKLYNLLSICSWRQGETDKAKGYALKAKSIGDQLGHRGVIAQAKNNLAIIASYQGQIQESIPLYEAVIDDRNFIEDSRTVAAALSNLAQDYQIFGDFEQSYQIQMQAIELYSKLGLDLNLSIAYCGLGLLQSELNKFNEAELAFEKSLEHAKASNYLRGLSAVKIYLADVYAKVAEKLNNNLDSKTEALLKQSHEFLKEGFEGFGKLNLNEALNFEIAGRLARIEKRFQDAEDFLLQGLKFGKDFPHEVASLNVEFSELWQAQGDASKAQYFKKQALEIYKKSGALLRVMALS